MQVVSPVDTILERHNHNPSAIIQILSDIQDEFSYLPRERVEEVSKKLNISLSQIFGIVTFYAHFKLTKPGKHSVQVCLGTACFVKNASIFLELFKNEEHVQPGETTGDGLYSLERVACVGNCGLAPIVVLDDIIQTEMSISKLRRLLKQLKRMEENP